MFSTSGSRRKLTFRARVNTYRCNIYRGWTIHVVILQFSFIKLGVYSTDSSKMIGNFPAILNFINPVISQTQPVVHLQLTAGGSAARSLLCIVCFRRWLRVPLFSATDATGSCSSSPLSCFPNPNHSCILIDRAQPAADAWILLLKSIGPPRIRASSLPPSRPIDLLIICSNCCNSDINYYNSGLRCAPPPPPTTVPSLPILYDHSMFIICSSLCLGCHAFCWSPIPVFRFCTSREIIAERGREREREM